MKINQGAIVSWILAFSLLMAGCGGGQLPSPADGSSADLTSVPADTPTLSSTPVAVVTQTATSTPEPVQPALEPIDSENIDNLKLLNQIGMGDPSGVRYSPDGQTLAIISSVAVCFFDAGDFSELGCYGGQAQDLNYGYGSTFRHILISPDFKYFIYSNGNSLLVLQIPDARLLFVITADNALLSADGKTIVSFRYLPTAPLGKNLDVVQVWDAEQRKVLHTFNAQGFQSLALSPDGKLLALIDEKKTVSLVSTGDFSVVQKWLVTDISVDKVVFSPDSAMVAVISNGAWGAMQTESGANGAVHIYSTSDGKLVWFKSGTGPVRDATFSADGTLFTLVSKNRIISVYDTTSWAAIADLAGTPLFGYNAVAFSPDGEKLVAVAARQNGISMAYSLLSYPVFIWDMSTEMLSHTFDGGEGTYNLGKVAFRPGYNELALITPVDVSIWSTDSQSLLKSIPVMVGSPIAISPDGKWLITSAKGGLLMLFDLAEGKLIQTLGDLNRIWVDEYQRPIRVEMIVFSPDGHHVATRSNDKEIALWDMDTGQRQSLVQIPVSSQSRGDSAQLVFSPDSKELTILQRDSIPSGNSSIYNIKLYQCELTGPSCVENERPLLGLNKNAPQFLFFSPQGDLMMVYRNSPVTTASDLHISNLTQCPVQEDVWSSEDCLGAILPYGEDVKDYSGYSQFNVTPDGTSLSALQYNQSSSYYIKWNIDTGRLEKRVRLYDSTSGNGIMALNQSPSKTMFLLNIRTSGDFETSYRSEFWNIQDEKMVLERSGLFRGIYSPDSTLFITLGNPMQIWGIKAGSTQASTLPRENSIVEIAYAPDGDSLAVVYDKGVNLLDAATQHVYQNLYFNEPINDIAYSPDGGLIAIALKGGNVKIWDLSGEGITTLKKQVAETNRVAFSRDGSFLAAGYSDGTLQLWSVATSDLIKSWEGHNTDISGLVFSPTADLLASSSLDGSLAIWSAVDGSLVHALDKANARVNELAFAPDSSVLASANEDGSIQFWDPFSGNLIRTLWARTAISDLAFSADGQFIASVVGEGEIYLWSADPQVGLLTMLQAGSTASRINTIALSPNAQTLIAGGSMGTIQSWNIPDETANRWVFPSLGQARNMNMSSYRTEGIAFSPDGGMLAAAGRAKLQLWSLPDGNSINTVDVNVGDQYWSNILMEYSPDGQVLVTAFGNKIKLWSFNGDTYHRVALENDFSYVGEIAISSDSKYLAVAGDNIIGLWSLPDGNLVRSWALGYVTSAYFSSDNSQLITAEYSGRIRVWSVPAGQLLKTIEKHGLKENGQIYFFDFLPKSDTFLVSYEDGTIQYWGLAEDQPRYTFRSRNDPVLLMAHSPDEKLLATLGHDGLIKLWYLQDHTLFRIFGGVSGNIYAFEFSPDGNYLAAGCSDGNVFLWDVFSP